MLRTKAPQGQIYSLVYGSSLATGVVRFQIEHTTQEVYSPAPASFPPKSNRKMEEPNMCVPRPSPYPPSRLADTSFSLEVTPERDAQRERKPVRHRLAKSSKFQIPSAQPGQVQSTFHRFGSPPLKRPYHAQICWHNCDPSRIHLPSKFITNIINSQGTCFLLSAFDHWLATHMTHESSV